MIEDLSSYQNHMSLYSLTEKEMTKVHIIEKRDKGAIDLDDVNTGLLCSVRTAYRYLSKYRKHGPPGSKVVSFARLNFYRNKME